ncbi:unnamed protein product [Penicillium salamii]|uniref:Uncharacterized protein n=1 Tax=Penicillium salamii TaxID=1612424 RepID=A0A9W4P0G8_9EURO|nr:unnamed protein product [Penicillium salamii]CAG8219926.1 unnamed protein product [Penicillium salamii]CAG8240986.1 unnamed protein product [Penicillium salamii]CAG8294321.1 unnamed protein product [Penicillium salamii]CAG8325345.1 unnamed protein product [Penicillium salamii]
MQLLPFTLFLALTAASPIACRGTLTEAQITTISPKSSSCDDAPSEGECATAKQAAKFIAQSFDTYKVTSKAEQAAVISLMAFESGDFKYNKNHFPGVAGQGTRNMQSPAFNKKYAASIPAVKDKAAETSDPADLLDLLRNDGTTDFGSGAWFLTTECSKEVRSALADGPEAGWKKYITDCVGTTITDDRKAYWDRAVKALGV